MNRTPHNDNDENSALPFETLGAITARLVEGAQKQEDDCERDRADDGEAKRKAEERRRYVAQRLREIERFERRARGDKSRW
jgi:hypothetical protein